MVGEHVKPLQILLSRKFYRSLYFWALSFFFIYTLIGFLVLPPVINKAVIDNVNQQLGWQTKIERIEFNPYNFSLALNNLTISDQQEKTQFAFKRLYINFELRSIINRAFTFSEIEMLQPMVHLTLDKKGKTNFQHAIEKQAELISSNEQPKQPQRTSSIPKLLVDNINIIDGQLNITDAMTHKAITQKIDSISFNLKDLMTYGKDQGHYKLNVSLGHGQRINAEGSLGITPLRSQGKFNIHNLRAQDFWPYVYDHVPYDLKKGRTNFSSNYQLNLGNRPVLFNLTQGNVQIKEMNLTNKDTVKSIAKIDSLNLEPLSFDLTEKKLQVETIRINAAHLNIERSKQGEINILTPFNSSETAQLKSASQNHNNKMKKQFQWAIADIQLKNSNIEFNDHQLTNNALTSINKITFEIKHLSQNLTKALPFELNYIINQSGSTNIKGKLAPSPLDVKAQLSIYALSLPIVQPYIDDLADIKIEQGTLHTVGDINLSHDKKGKIKGYFQGNVNVENFSSQDKKFKQPLVTWHSLNINPLKVNFNPLTINISEINLDKPYARLIIEEDRTVNLSQLAIRKSSEKSKKETLPAQHQSEPIDVKINNISIKNGGAYFADLSLHPQFATSIQNINGVVNGLSSDKRMRADVDLAGNIEEFGKMKIKGQINPLAKQLYTDINVNFNKIELTPFTPYSGRYVGYAIDKGKLNLNLHYKIANNKLDSQNYILLNKFELGDKIESDEAINIPLKLALALFKDNDGIIDIMLPIDGRIDSPSFSIGSLALQAFKNIINKAITSPFSILANLVKGDPEKLNALAFQLGSSELTKDNIEQLNTLAEVLKKRPNLILEIRPRIDKKQDSLALQISALHNQLQQEGINSPEQQKRLAALKHYLINHDSEDQFDKLESAMEIAIDNAKKQADSATKTVVIMNKYEQSLQQAAAIKQPISDLALTALAQQRVNIIKAQLINNENVDSEQIFSLKESLTGKANDNSITTLFTLATR